MAGEIIRVCESTLVPVDCILLNGITGDFDEAKQQKETGEPGECNGVSLDTSAYDGIVNPVIKGGPQKASSDLDRVGRLELLGLRTTADLSQLKGKLSYNPEEDLSELTVEIELTAGVPGAPITYEVDYKRDFVPRGTVLLSTANLWAVVLAPVHQCKMLYCNQVAADQQYERFVAEKRRQAELARLANSKARPKRNEVGGDIIGRLGTSEEKVVDAIADEKEAEDEPIIQGIDKAKIEKEQFRRMLMIVALACTLLTALVVGIYFGLHYSYDSSSSAVNTPGAPSWVAAQANSGGVSLNFRAPSSDGGAPVVSYAATAYLNNVNVTTITQGAEATCDELGETCLTGFTFTGLTNGGEYTFKLVAYNVNGASPMSTAVTATPTDWQAIAMGKFFSATGGLTHWLTRTGWDPYVDVANYGQNTHYCTWFGVTCVNQTVTRINLAENNITGVIPEEIKYLTGLESLSLYDNKITGTLPKTIGALTSLTELNMNLNCLNGALPAELNQLTALTTFNIGLYTGVGSEFTCGLGITSIPSSLEAFFGRTNGAAKGGTATGGCNLGGHESLVCAVPVTARSCTGYEGCDN